jgi:hypothetical protein
VRVYDYQQRNMKEMIAANKILSESNLSREREIMKHFTDDTTSSPQTITSQMHNTEVPLYPLQHDTNSQCKLISDKVTTRKCEKFYIVYVRH